MKINKKKPKKKKQTIVTKRKQNGDLQKSDLKNLKKLKRIQQYLIIV